MRVEKTSLRLWTSETEGQDRDRNSLARPQDAVPRRRQLKPPLEERVGVHRRDDVLPEKARRREPRQKLLIRPRPELRVQQFGRLVLARNAFVGVHERQHGCPVPGGDEDNAGDVVSDPHVADPGTAWVRRPDNDRPLGLRRTR